jgi:hypothetical protein
MSGPVFEHSMAESVVFKCPGLLGERRTQTHRTLSQSILDRYGRLASPENVIFKSGSNGLRFSRYRFQSVRLDPRTGDPYRALALGF